MCVYGGGGGGTWEKERLLIWLKGRSHPPRACIISQVWRPRDFPCCVRPCITACTSAFWVAIAWRHIWGEEGGGGGEIIKMFICSFMCGLQGLYICLFKTACVLHAKWLRNPP